MSSEWRISENADTGIANVLMPQQSCALLNEAYIKTGVIAGGGAAGGGIVGYIAAGVKGIATGLFSAAGTAANGWSYANTNRALCTGGTSVTSPYR